MADANDLMLVLKNAALDAVRASKPVSLLFGRVAAVSPLQIAVDQKIRLTREFLTLSPAVTKRTVEMTIDGKNRTVTVDGSLKTGERVALLRCQGGGKYLVLERVADG